MTSRRVLIRRGAAGALLGWGTGCAGSGEGSKPQSGPPPAVTFIKTPFGTEKDAAWVDTFAEAQKATGVQITVKTEPAADFWDKRQAERAAGTASGDAMYNQPNWVYQGGFQGLFIDHFPLLRRDKVDLKQYYKADMDGWTWKDKLWGISFQFEGETVIYNKQLLDARGVKYPAPTWTYDDLLQMSLKLTDRGANSYAVHFENNTIQYGLGTFIRGFGGKVYNEARDRAVYADDTNAVRGVEFAVDLYGRYEVAPRPQVVASLPAGTRPMETKLVAMNVGDISRRVSIAAAIGADNFDVAPPPKGPTGAQSARTYGNAWSILTSSKVPDAVWKTIKWTHSKEGLSGAQVRAIGWPPVTWAGTLPQWQEQFKGKHIADVLKVWETGGHNQLPPEGTDALNLMNAPFTRAFRGEMGTRDAIRESADAANQLFARRPAAWK